MIKIAPFLIKLFLKATKSYGITMPWKTIYLMPDNFTNQRLIRHEQAHVMQIERDGAIIWTLKIFYYLIRYGYQNSPYEVEARRLSDIV